MIFFMSYFDFGFLLDVKLKSHAFSFKNFIDKSILVKINIHFF